MLPMNILKSVQNHFKYISLIPQQRNFWEWVNKMFNTVDENRIKEIGPDHACAEWLIKNGASVRWYGDTKLFNIYDNIKHSPKYIEEIDASNSSIMHYGFPHLKNCKYIKKIVLHKCYYLYDEALIHLENVNQSLEYLQISSCGNITSKGLYTLKNLTNLKTLVLFDLIGVTNTTETKTKLIQTLPNSKIVFD